jgi:hypothetical protein
MSPVMNRSEILWFIAYFIAIYYQTFIYETFYKNVSQTQIKNIIEAFISININIYCNKVLNQNE